MHGISPFHPWCSRAHSLECARAHLHKHNGSADLRGTHGSQHTRVCTLARRSAGLGGMEHAHTSTRTHACTRTYAHMHAYTHAHTAEAMAYERARARARACGSAGPGAMADARARPRPCHAALTQKRRDRLFEGPRFEIEARYPVVLNSLFVTMFYAGPCPLLVLADPSLYWYLRRPVPPPGIG